MQISKKAVVAILGHIDHGKSQLVDFLCQTNNISQEAGGITQNIRLQNINKKYNLPIIVCDTPGHQLFHHVRQMAIHISNYVLLVVDGRQGPQSETEIILNSLPEDKELILVITKIDLLKNKDLSKVYEGLARIGCYSDKMSGDVPTFLVSSITGEGIDSLLEYLEVRIEIQEMKIQDKLAANAIVIDVFRKDRQYHSLLWLKQGILKNGDFFSCGDTFGKIKFLQDNGQNVKKVNENSIITCSGYDKTPKIGSILKVALSKKIAQRNGKNNKFLSFPKNTTPLSNDKKIKKLFLKGDTQIYLEALENLFQHHNIITSSIGDITTKDLQLLKCNPDAIVVCFGTLKKQAIGELDALNITYYQSLVIYDLIKNLKESKKTIIEEELGSAKLLKLFVLSNGSHIAGCTVLSGEISLGDKVKVLRNNEEIAKDITISSLKREKDKITNAKKGSECGFLLKTTNNRGYFSNLKEGDIIITYKQKTQTVEKSIV